MEGGENMPYATNQGVRIHYEVEGQGPPLVLMTGSLGTLEDWRDSGYAQVLSQDYRLILIDPRGRGGSDKPHEVDAYDSKLMVDDLVAILDDLNITKAHYFGYSMGAGIGFSIPIYAPERFYSLILGGFTYPIIGNEIRDAALVIALQEGLEQAIETAPDRPMEVFVAGLERTVGPYPPVRRARMLALDARALSASVRSNRFTVWPKAEEVLPNITIPCLIFAGEADASCVGARECASRMPNATFFSLPGLRHFEAAFRSDLVLPHIKKFLAEASKSLPH